MKPDIAVYFRELIRTIREDFAPKLPTAFEQGAAVRFSVLTQAVAEEFDRAAARRIEENNAIRELFLRAAPNIAKPDLEARLRAAGATEEKSLRVRDLDQSNNELRALLLEMHAHVETMTDDKARELEEAIWSELVASTQRRILSIGRF